VSLDGYFTDASGGMSWVYNNDPEWQTFVEGNARGGGELLFGRVTYDLMVSYWPTPSAIQSLPVVAERMNNLPKVVFSRTMDKAAWNNTRLVKDNIVEEVRNMKRQSGVDMAILGSGSIVSQLTQEKLIDEYQFAMIPVILGRGRTMFEGVKNALRMELTRSRIFRNGNVLLCYKPVKN
jgi:dihydrofolate reductase